MLVEYKPAGQREHELAPVGEWADAVFEQEEPKRMRMFYISYEEQERANPKQFQPTHEPNQTQHSQPNPKQAQEIHAKKIIIKQREANPTQLNDLKQAGPSPKQS